MKSLANLVVVISLAFASHAFAREIVLYTSVDEPVAAPIVKAFTKETGIAVKLVTDTEATKSVGLTARLRAEKDAPRCDVWWSNEIFLTVGLKANGLFEPYESPSAKEIPDQFKDKDHQWASVGIRARVLATNMDLTNVRIKAPSLQLLADASLKGKIVMCNPSIGTAAGHVAALYSIWGQEKADAFFKALHDSELKLVGGNSVVVQQLAAGNFTYGLTDNDDVASANADGAKLTMFLPDQAENADGTLAMPTTVALVKRTDVDPDAKKLIDYLLSQKCEKQLIDQKYAGWSVRAKESEFRAMKVDYEKAAKILPDAVRRAVSILETGETK